MISPINTIFNNTYISNANRQNKIPMQQAAQMDTVSFTSKPKVICQEMLKMLNKLEAEAPVLGFKGDGKWLLPNLSKGVGQKYNLYMADGSQLSYYRSDWKDNVLFTFKQNKLDEKIPSKITLKEVDEHLEFKKLKRTKAEEIITFRVNTKDSAHDGQKYKAGEVYKIGRDKDGYLLDFADVSNEEFDKINKILEKYLPYFF